MTIDITKSTIGSSEGDIFFAMIGSIPGNWGAHAHSGFIEELLEAEVGRRLGLYPIGIEHRFMIPARQEGLIRAGQFLAHDEQWAAIEPHLPMVHTGRVRKDDRRSSADSSIGCARLPVARASDVNGTIYRQFSTGSMLEPTRFVAAIFTALIECCDPPALTMIDSSAVKAHRSRAAPKRGRKNQAIGRSRGGRHRTKIHALVDEDGRPHAFLLTAGHVADIKGRRIVARGDSTKRKLIGRQRLRRGSFEELFEPLATRYDKTVKNFLAGLCLITALGLWLN